MKLNTAIKNLGDAAGVASMIASNPGQSDEYADKYDSDAHTLRKKDSVKPGKTDGLAKVHGAE